jgi:hypothetical protein
MYRRVLGVESAGVAGNIAAIQGEIWYQQHKKPAAASGRQLEGRFPQRANLKPSRC